MFSSLSTHRRSRRTARQPRDSAPVPRGDAVGRPGPASPGDVRERDGDGRQRPPVRYLGRLGGHFEGKRERV